MRYLVRERLFSITDDFWVTDEQGDKVFFVDAKILSLRHALELKDASGRKLATIKHRLVTFTDAMEIESDDGVLATVHKAVFSPLHHRANIDLVGADTEAGARMAEQAAFLEFATREMAGLLTRWQQYQAGSG